MAKRLVGLGWASTTAHSAIIYPPRLIYLNARICQTVEGSRPATKKDDKE